MPPENVVTDVLVLITAGLAVLSGFLSWRLHAQADRAYDRRADAENLLAGRAAQKEQLLDTARVDLKEAVNSVEIDKVTNRTTGGILIVFLLSLVLILSYWWQLDLSMQPGAPSLSFMATLAALLFILILTGLSIIDTGSIAHRLETLKSTPTLEFSVAIGLVKGARRPSWLLGKCREIYLRDRPKEIRTSSQSSVIEKDTYRHHTHPACRCKQLIKSEKLARKASEHVPTWLLPKLVPIHAPWERVLCETVHLGKAKEEYMWPLWMQAQRQTLGLASSFDFSAKREGAFGSADPMLQLIFVGYAGPLAPNHDSHADERERLPFMKRPANEPAARLEAAHFLEFASESVPDPSINVRAVSLLSPMWQNITHQPQTVGSMWSDQGLMHRRLEEHIETMVGAQVALPPKPSVTAYTGLLLVQVLREARHRAAVQQLNIRQLEKVVSLARQHIADNVLSAISRPAERDSGAASSKDRTESLKLFGLPHYNYKNYGAGIISGDFTADCLNIGLRNILNIVRDKVHLDVPVDVAEPRDGLGMDSSGLPRTAGLVASCAEVLISTRDHPNVLAAVLAMDLIIELERYRREQVLSGTTPSGARSGRLPSRSESGCDIDDQDQLEISRMCEGVVREHISTYGSHSTYEDGKRAPDLFRDRLEREADGRVRFWSSE